MTCGCEKFEGMGCVCDAVRHIFEMQEAAEEECPTSCFSNLLSPEATLGDTIPFILFCRNECDETFGAFGDVGGEDCFRTVFFRVRAIREGCCATLELLRAFKDNRPLSIKCADEICDVTRLERTDFCIEVDLNCFCAIQCLDPRLLSRVRGREKRETAPEREHKHEHEREREREQERRHKKHH